MKKIITFLSFFLITICLNAQVSNVNVKHGVYDFLSIMAQKGVIEYNDLVKPLSRRYVAQKLIEVDENKRKLSGVQKDELRFYLAEFGYEVEKISKRVLMNYGHGDEEKRSVNDEEEKGGSGDEAKGRDGEKEKVRDLTDKSWQIEVRKPKNIKTEFPEKEKYKFFKDDKYGRFRFFSYLNKNLYLNINPNLGYEKGSWEGDSYGNLFLGLNFHGEIGNVLGFNFDVVNTRMEPTVRNILYNDFTKNTDFNIQLADRNRIEYSELNVDMGTSWDWGSLTIGKNYINWGYAENGKLVLSGKAPSFPYVRLDIHPTDWFTFNYLHGWLVSEVVDTSSLSSSWRTYDNRSSEEDEFSYIPKFIAFHSITFHIWDGFDLSMGESSVYSGNFELAYLIPIMFFDLADEFLNGSNNYVGASTQLFFSASSRNHIPNTHLYGTFHADELTPDGLFDPKTQYYKFGFTLGGYVVDLPLNNVGVRLEYTKIYPGNYRHFIPSLTYESSNSLMGHWMGDNGDLFYAALDIKPIRGLKIKIWTQQIRKGTEALGNRAYQIQIPQPHFLFTDNIQDRKNYSYFGAEVDYEYLHDLWLKLKFRNIDYEQRYDYGKFNSTKFGDFSFTLRYGL